MAEAQQYMFYITTKEGEDICWHGLTEIQAYRMNRTTTARAPSNILRFGWSRDPLQSLKTKKEKDNESID